MTFTPKNFRRISNPPPIKIRDAGPLILVKENGEAGFASMPADKDIIIQKFEPEKDMLLWGWPGKFRTDIFLLSAEDLKLYYK